MFNPITWLIEKIHYWSWSKLDDKERREKNTQSCKKSWPLWHHRLINHRLGGRELGMVVGDITMPRFKGYQVVRDIQSSLSPEVVE